MKRLCPIFFADNKPYTACLESDCMWWIDFCDDCCIPIISQVLIGNDSYKTDFTKSNIKNKNSQSIKKIEMGN